MEKLSLPHRFWRALPRDARRNILSMAAGLLAPRAQATPPAASPGLVVAGELNAATGVGQAARVYAAAAARLGVARGEITLGIGARPSARPAAGAALLLSVNAPSLPLVLARAGGDYLKNRYVFSAWAWELPVVPREWFVGRRYAHEVWACSPFTAAALEPVLPGRVRVVPYPLALAHLPEKVAANRAAFGLAEEVVVTLMVFGLGSSFTRKNPMAGIAAFRRAFGNRAEQLLVVKYSGAAAYPREAAAIEAQAGANIKVFSGNWPAEKISGLIACADIVLSLHRAEGFGLVPAEAMLLGKPVIATGWSGNLAFMDAGSAALVGYTLVPVQDATGVYGKIPGAVWAEPDTAHAAEWLRKLGDDPAARQALGARGEDYARKALAGAEMRAALRAHGIDGC